MDYIFSRIISGIDNEHIDYETVATANTEAQAAAVSVRLLRSGAWNDVRVSIWRGDNLTGPFPFLEFCDHIGLYLSRNAAGNIVVQYDPVEEVAHES